MFLHQWPLVYPTGGASYSYYFGYYLVPAMIFKALGFISAEILFLWTFLGFTLGTAWMYLVLDGKVLYIFFCLGLGASADVISFLLRQVAFNPYALYGDVAIWMPSVLGQVQWVPNQTIPVLVVSSMLIYLVKTKGDLQELVLPVVLCLWWAVFPTLLCGLVLGIMLIRQWWASGIDWFGLLTKVLVPALACLPLIFLFLSHKSVPISGFAWQFDEPIEWISRYLVEIALNILIFCLAFVIIYKNRPKHDGLTYVFYLVIVIMMVVPLYRMGVYNDFLFKGILPCLLMTGLTLFIPLAEKPSYRFLFRLTRRLVFNFLVMGLLLLSTGASVRLLTLSTLQSRIATKLLPGRKPFEAVPFDQYGTIYEMPKEKYSKNDAEQYYRKRGLLLRTIYPMNTDYHEGNSLSRQWE